MRLSKNGRRLQDLVGGAVVWDNHACMPLRPGDDRYFEELLRCRAAGIDCVTLNIGFGENSPEQHVRVAAHFRDWIARHDSEFQLVLVAEDFARAKLAGKLGICFNIEGMNALGQQTSMVRLYYDLGVRWMLIAYNAANAAGGGCREADGGLTDFGRAVIAEMNEVGMILCCSHTGYRTARDAIDASADPVIFSHSNARAIWDHPRNITDELMRACAARGGVIGLNGFGQFLGDNDDSTETFVRHVEHVLAVAGDDHVGIGLDYVFDKHELPVNLYGPSPKMIPPWRLPEIAEVLLQRGYGSTTLAKIMGGNLERIARSVWAPR